MEKLIDLLNEFDENRKIGKNGLYKWEEYDPREEYIISKNFGFIKWLVENEKIDTRKIDEDRLETIQYSEKERVTICDWLLMLLSIQDEPMNFLIPLLK